MSITKLLGKRALNFSQILKSLENIDKHTINKLNLALFDQNKACLNFLKHKLL